MTDRLPARSNTMNFEEILDLCVEEIVSGRASVQECLDRYPDHRLALEPALGDIAALVALPVPAPQPNPARREAFMASIRETPQVAPRRRFGLPSLPSIPWSAALPSFGLGGLAMRVVPAAAVALLAIVVVLAQGGGTASAATLTVFTGQVEREVDGTWTPLDDGAQVTEGDSIRTMTSSHALLTFPDGSTAALDPDTQVALARLEINGRRQIELTQATGRLWNDVVTLAGSTSYVIVTPHATVEAHGTVFETVVNGDTAVSISDGLVRVVSAASSVEVLAGQIVRAAAGKIDTPEQIPFIGEITVRGPLAAALSSPDGAATGLLPSGVVFRQVPGVTTTVPVVGEQQRMFVGNVEPGVYALVLRRYEDGDGIVVIETPSGRLNIPVAANVQTARVLIAIDVLDDGVFMRALDTQLEEVEAADAPAVRVVETDRTRDAVALNVTVAVETATPTQTATPEATESRGNGRDNPGDGRGRFTATPERGTATATARPSPTLTYEQELRLAVAEALQTNDNSRLQVLLDDLLSGNDRQDATRLRVLATLMADPAVRIRVVALLQVGGAPRFSRDLRDALDELDDRTLRDSLRLGLGEVLPTDDRGRDSGNRGRDSSTATPEATQPVGDNDRNGTEEADDERRGFIPGIVDGVRDRLRERDRTVPTATATPAATPTATSTATPTSDRRGRR
jgi:hypothetical protein